jgi:hypothetical protein
VPGDLVRLGHGDAMHVTDIDPERPGLEIYMVHEGGPWAPYGHALRDAATGEVIYGDYTGVDTGRGMVGDILPEEPGLEAWASNGVGLWTADGDFLRSETPGTDMSIRWAADLTTQIVNGALDVTPSIDDWQRGRLLTAEGTLTNNGTKGNPSLVADILGDWREEMLVRTADSSALRIFLSTEVTGHKLYTLMHDPQYRAEVARQQTTYNQPSDTSFYLASDIDWSQVPVPDHWARAASGRCATRSMGTCAVARSPVPACGGSARRSAAPSGTSTPAGPAGPRRRCATSSGTSSGRGGPTPSPTRRVPRCATGPRP